MIVSHDFQMYWFCGFDFPDRVQYFARDLHGTPRVHRVGGFMQPGWVYQRAVRVWPWGSPRPGAVR